MTMRFDPFQELDRFTRQMLGSGQAPRSMPMEAYRRRGQFFVHLDLPEVNPDDVQLTMEPNVVAVRAERRPFWEQGDEVLVDETPRAPWAASCSWATTWTPAGWRPASTRHPDPYHPGRRTGQAPPHPAQLTAKSTGPGPPSTA